MRFFLPFSVLNVAPSIPSQTPPHRKVTGGRNKTGDIQHLRTTFLFSVCQQSTPSRWLECEVWRATCDVWSKIEHGSRFHAVRQKFYTSFWSFWSPLSPLSSLSYLKVFNCYDCIPPVDGSGSRFVTSFVVRSWRWMNDTAQIFDLMTIFVM